MKYLSIIVIFIVMSFVVRNVSSTNWNIAIYSLALTFLVYKLFTNLWRYYKVRHSPTLEGTIISSTERNTGSGEEIKYDVDVKFTSPGTNKEYIIQSTIEKLPKNNMVDVLYNESYPESSRVYTKYDIWGNIFMAFLLVFFMYYLLKTIFHPSPQ